MPSKRRQKNIWLFYLESKQILNGFEKTTQLRKAGGLIEQPDPVYDWREQEIFNQIVPLIETRAANLKKKITAEG